MTRVFQDYAAKLAAGAPLTPDEARALWATTDLVSLGMLADEARRRRHGDRVTFVRVAEVALDEAEHATWPAAAGEIRLVGVPTSEAQAVDAVAPIVARAQGVPVTAWSLTDLEALCGREPGRLSTLVESLVRAGLSAISEARIDELGDARGAVEAVARAAGSIARFTVAEPAADPLSRVRDVRAIQKATGLLGVFAPLPRRLDVGRPTTGYDDVKAVALARLLLDHVPSIQVDWALHGPKLAQVALLFGADDVDAVPAVDDLGEGRRRAPLEEIRRNARAAGLMPIERDGRFAVHES